MSTDRLTIRTVVFTLASVVVVGVTAMVLLAATHTAIPDQLDRLVVGALSGLVGLLAKTSSNEPSVDPEPPRPTTGAVISTGGSGSGGSGAATGHVAVPGSGGGGSAALASGAGVTRGAGGL